MKRILLFEPNKERIPHLIFLLNLADIRCTVARTIEEALNWLSNVRLQVIHFDLLLLGQLEDFELEKKILAEISSSITLPVVYVLREGLQHPEPLSDGIVTCHPDNMLGCLRQCLITENKKPQKEKVE